MELGRREFCRAAGLGVWGAAAPAVPRYFGLHPFIEGHPKAVFIRRTRVPDKADEAAKLREGLTLAREIFRPRDTPGVPITHRIVLKPNVTPVRGRNRPAIENWGAATDPQLYEGLILGLKELGLTRFHFAEANNQWGWNWRGFLDIHERHGVQNCEPDRRPRNFREDYQMVWAKVPDPVVFTRIPYYPPVSQSDTWLLNIAKWKCHGMCMSLSVKNEQGLVVQPFVRFCGGWPTVLGVPDWMKAEIHPQVERSVTAAYQRHLKLGYARYDSRAELSPIRQELWAQKTCDNMSVLRTGLAILDGIYGRDGDGFGTGNDYLTNLLMFSLDKFRLDLVGMYLGGHEPGNVHLFRIAKERGLTDTFNPWEVPVYEWIDGQAVPRKLSDFPRTPLKTYYLQKDGEPYFHLVNEPFDYDKIKV